MLKSEKHFPKDVLLYKITSDIMPNFFIVTFLACQQETTIKIFQMKNTY